MRLSVLLLFILTNSFTGFAQDSKLDPIINKGLELTDELLHKKIDTNYIETFDYFNVKISGQNRVNTLGIKDGRTGNDIRYIPDIGVTLGIGGATKSFSFDINTYLGISQDNINSSDYTDIQFQFFTKQHYLRFRYQYYLGYRLSGSSADISDALDEEEVRGDLRTVQFGMQYLYCIQYNKLSIKAPFALNERQKKSAGSFLAGFDFNIYDMAADSSIIPQNLEKEGSPWNGFSHMNLATISLNVGYMYSLVIKKRLFITASVIPGIGIKKGDYEREERRQIENALLLQFSSLNAIGYNGDRFAVAIQMNLTSSYSPMGKNLTVNLLEGRSSLYFAYRI